MKNLLILAFVLISVCAFGQEEKKFNFGFSINPGISNNILSSSGDVPKEVVNNFKELEKPAFAYQISAFSEYPINTYSKLRIGLGFSKTAYKTSKNKTSVTVPDPTLAEYTQFHWQHQDIIIPMLYSKYFKNGISPFYFIGGLVTQIKVDRRIKWSKWFSDGSKNTEQIQDASTTYRRMNINFLVGIGCEINISAKTKIFIQPTFDCNLLGTSKDANLNRRMYTFGLTIGTLID